MQQNKLSRTSIFIFAAIIALIAFCVYMLVERNKIIKASNIALQQKQRTIDSVKTNRLYLQADFDAASTKIDQLMSVNAKLKDSLQRDKVSIAELRTKIKNILADKNAAQAELMLARNMLYLLISKAQDYEAYMAELERDNVILEGENALLTAERDNTVEKNIALKMTGSVLHTSNIRMELIHTRRNGKEKETSRARKADKIQIVFDIDENRIAESGTKQIYVRLITPEGKVLSFTGVSGMLNTAQGRKIGYSALKEVDLAKNQPLKGVVMEWPYTEVYTKGAYKVELYNLGYKIGETTARLK